MQVMGALLLTAFYRWNQILIGCYLRANSIEFIPEELTVLSLSPRVRSERLRKSGVLVSLYARSEARVRIRSIKK